MSFLDLLIGKPLANWEETGERIGPAAGIPIFGLDALSSAAYGPEAALTLLIPLGALGIAYIVPISGAIIALLTIVYFSYRQTIDAYPNGGGSYTVARENVGEGAGLLAGAALLIDYVLTAAVGISAGVGALVSAVPSLLPHTLAMCLGILLLITIVNLRGVKEAGGIFMIPTYLFLGTLLITILIGVVRALAAHGHPMPVIAPPPVPAATAMVGAWLVLKAFASGCTALTGVEAVSNGVRAFRDPTAANAKKTLTVIIGLLIILLAGIAWLVKAYHIAATDPGAMGYQSVLSMLVAAVAGRGAFYYTTIASILLVLSLSANTAFADLPRLCRIIALDGYLPRSLRQPRAPPGAFPGDLRVDLSDRRSPHHVWRRHRSLDSALCGGSVPGLHALAIGHGVSLEAGARPALRALHVCQRPGRARYGDHGPGRAGREVCRRRLDHVLIDPRTSAADVCSPSAL
jgi:amino acid transporter